MAMIRVDWPARGSAQEVQVENVLTLGRSVDCDIVVEDSSVSAKHACIMKKDCGYVLINLHSMNGVFIRDQKVEQEATLTHGDTIYLSDIRCKFINPDDPSDEAEEQSSTTNTTLKTRPKTVVKMPKKTKTFKIKGPSLPKPQQAPSTSASAGLDELPVLNSLQGVSVVPLQNQEAISRPSVFAATSIVTGVLGPMLGFGWLVGLALGLAVLVANTKDTSDSDRRMSLCGVVLSLVWLTALIWVGYRHFTT